MIRKKSRCALVSKQETCSMVSSDAIDPFAIIARHQVSAPVSVEAIASDLGIHLVDRLLPDGDESFLARDGEGTFGYSIQVDHRLPLPSRRFAIAKEVAHFALHRDMIEHGLIVDSRSIKLASNFFEDQAINFALHILVPQKDLDRFLINYGFDILKISDLFVVPPAVMQRYINRIHNSKGLDH